jgi:hypothetical protein
MAGFVWKYRKEYVDDLTWKISISTTRQRYGGVVSYPWWDEDVSAYYVSGPRANEPLQAYRERVAISLEKVLLVGEVREGELIAIFKDKTLCKYALITKNEIVALDPDFEPVVGEYVAQGLSVDWLLSQENAG